MRKNRIVLLGLWILSLAGISLSGGEITYGIFGLLTLLPVISLVYIFIVRALFKIYQNVEGNSLVAGHPAVFSFILQNECPVIFAGVRVLFYSSFSSISGLSDQIEYELMPGEGIRRKTDILCHYRGEYEIGIKTIEITDFFRLFTIPYRNPEPKLVRVKPNIIYLSEPKHLDLTLVSVQDASFSNDVPDLLMREYIPGDDPRFINWKASGASGRLMVRQRTGEQQEGIGIVLDSMRYGEEPAEYLPHENKMLEAVIALNLYLSQKGMPAETWIYAQEKESFHVTREGGFDAFYDRMCSYRFETEHPSELLFDQLMTDAEIFRKKLVVFIIHEWNSAAAKAAEQLNRHNAAVLAYVINDNRRTETGMVLPRTEITVIPSDADLTEVM